MTDEIYDRNLQAARDDRNAAIVAAISRLSRACGNVFDVLNRIEYRAPWGQTAEKVRCG